MKGLFGLGNLVVSALVALIATVPLSLVPSLRGTSGLAYLSIVSF
jgi:hypothetical protein